MYLWLREQAAVLLGEKSKLSPRRPVTEFVEGVCQEMEDLCQRVIAAGIEQGCYTAKMCGHSDGMRVLTTGDPVWTLYVTDQQRALLKQAYAYLGEQYPGGG